MSKEIVAQAKADLLAAGYDLRGNNGAFLITMEAASRIPGAGVYEKPSGNNAEFEGGHYSVDIIMFKDGRYADCLINGGGDPPPDPSDPWNEPTWNESMGDGKGWHAPKAILHVPPAPCPGPQPTPSGDFRSRVDGYMNATAYSLDVLHKQQRMIGHELGVMDLDGNLLETPSRLTRLEQQFAALANNPSGDGFMLDPKQLTALLPVLTQVFEQWLKAQQNAARVTVTPAKKK